MLHAAVTALRTGLSSGGIAAASSGSSAARQQCSKQQLWRQLAAQQQRRGAHELHVHKNKFVESWLSRREDFETEFRWDAPTTRAVLIGAFVIPIATYNMLVAMAHADDDYAERPRRDFLWGHAERGPGR